MTPLRLLRPLLYVAHQAQRRSLDAVAARTLAAEIPELAAVDREIASVTGTSDRGYWKYVDLLRHLRAARPARIAELGSGRTSFVFAWYAHRNGVAYEAFEQSADWADLVNGIIERRLGARPVRHCELLARPTGARFAPDIAPGSDFIYIDAPSAGAGPWQTFTGKAAYYDAPEYLAAGHRPARIVIDGRTDTADLLLAADAATDYGFRGEFAWAIQRNRLGPALAFRRHSVFTLRSAAENGRAA